MTKEEALQIKEAYQKGEGSLRELAIRFNQTESAVQARCKREGWRKEMSQMARTVSEKVANSLAEQQLAHRTMVASRVQDYMDKLDKLKDKAFARVVEVNPQIFSLSFQRLDEVKRKALLMDEKKEADIIGAAITLTGLALQQQMIREIQELRAISETDAAKDLEIDVEILAKMEVIKGE